MRATGVLAGDKQTWQVRVALGVDLHSAHVEMGGRRNFHRLSAQVLAEVGTSLDHAREHLLDYFSAEV